MWRVVTYNLIKWGGNMLGQKLTALRKDKNLTQQQMADALGMSRGTLGHYEIGRREPDYETLQQFADFFGVTTDYLLGRTPKEETKYIFRETDKDGYNFEEPSERDRATSDLRQALDIAIAKGKMTEADATEVIVGFHRQIELLLKNKDK